MIFKQSEDTIGKLLSLATNPFYNDKLMQKIYQKIMPEVYDAVTMLSECIDNDELKTFYVITSCHVVFGLLVENGTEMPELSNLDSWQGVASFNLPNDVDILVTMKSIAELCMEDSCKPDCPYHSNLHYFTIATLTMLEHLSTMDEFSNDDKCEMFVLFQTTIKALAFELKRLNSDDEYDLKELNGMMKGN